MVNIVCGYFKMNGTVTSLLDTYFNLKKYLNDVTFNIVCNPKHIKNFLKYKCDYPNIECIALKKTSFDTLIISADFIGQYYNIFKLFNYNKLIILDSFKIYIDNYKNKNFTANIINELQKCYVLGNNFNKQFFKSNYYLYYHKFSKDRLDFLKLKYSDSNDSTILLRKESDKDYYLHKFSSYNYERFHTCDNVTYIENIGKMIFEYRYLNKQVHYSIHNKTIDDGLTEYLSLFDIDDNYSQDIFITEKDIQDKLFMKDNDLILSIISI